MSVVTMSTELDLTNVPPDDQHMLQNICAVVHTLYDSTGLQNMSVVVLPSSQAYNLLVQFAPNCIVQVSKSDMETIVDVNPLRISSVNMLCDTSQSTPRIHLQIKVFSHDYPLMITDTHIVKVVKKRRWKDDT